MERAEEEASNQPDDDLTGQVNLDHCLNPWRCIHLQADQKPIAAPAMSSGAEKKIPVPKVRSSQRPRKRHSKVGRTIVQPRMPIWPNRAPSEGSGSARPSASRSMA